MIDTTPIVQPILAGLGVIVTSLVAIYTPRVIAVFETRTKIQLTENQRKTVIDAVQTAAGVLETALDQGAAKVEHIQVGSPQVQEQAQRVINAVPNAAAALGLNTQSIERMVVGAVDTGAHGVTTATTVVTAPDEVVTKTAQGTQP